MGLLSKYRSKKGLGHARTNTSSSLIIGSEFLNMRSDSSNSSNEATGYLIHDKLKQHQHHPDPTSTTTTTNSSYNGGNKLKSSPYMPQSPQRTTQLTRSQGSSPNLTRKAPGDSVFEESPSQGPYSPSLDPGSRMQLVESLYQPKVRPPKHSKQPSGHSPLSGPVHGADALVRSTSGATFTGDGNTLPQDLGSSPSPPTMSTLYNYPKTTTDGSSEDHLKALFNDGSAKNIRPGLTGASDDSNKHSFKSGTILQNMLELSLNPTLYRYISDYDRYFFEGTDDESDYRVDDTKIQPLDHPAMNQNRGAGRVNLDKEATIKQNNHPNYPTQLSNYGQSEPSTFEKPQIRPGVGRSNSANSVETYNLIERGDSGKFRVLTTDERIKRITSVSMSKRATDPNLEQSKENIPIDYSSVKKQDTIAQAERNFARGRSDATPFDLKPRLSVSRSVSNFHAAHSHSNSGSSFSTMGAGAPLSRNLSHASRRASTLMISSLKQMDPRMSASQADFSQSFGMPQMPRLQTSNSFGYNGNYLTEYVGAKRHTLMGGAATPGGPGMMQYPMGMPADRQSVMLPYGYGSPMGYMQPMMPQSRSNSPLRLIRSFNPLQFHNLDADIVRKIESYLDLRNIIAQGNKSIEYRLKWVKMLILLVNAKLYMYINIKGDPVSPELIPQQHLLFTKSTVNHTLRLLRECEGKERYEEVFSDICYIYGCLLKNDYVELYQQDFGVEKNIDEALRFFERSIEVRTNNFKSYFRLGELYEDELYPNVEPREGEPDFLESALTNYKQSAQYGYNKAIYRIALLYFNVPHLRSHRCIKYFGDLANVDTKLTEIRLEEEDRDELDFVIGSAAYQMGRIYEGLYPGDLTADSAFVTKCLELAPVNWNKALAYYNKAARLNNVNAQVRLGKVYENGELDRQQNLGKSIQWYFKASRLQNPSKRNYQAMLGLSRWYMTGTGGMSRIIPYPEPANALLWCNRALELNAAEAYFQRGILAEQGLGVEPAEQFFQIAYEMGHEEAGARLPYAGSEPEYDDEPEIEPEEVESEAYEYNPEEEFKI